MSLVGLLESEKRSKAMMAKIRKSLLQQQQELKLEAKRIEAILSVNKNWKSQPASRDKLQELLAKATEIEKLYLTAGDTNAARIFKERTQKQLSEQLTNLKAAELETKLRVAQVKEANKQEILAGLNNVKTDGRNREMYAQARKSGGFLSSFARRPINDIVTLETKAAGSKTLGNYMKNLYNTYEQGLKKVFVQGIVRGEGYNTMSKNLQKITDITSGKANILIRTEANAVFNDAVKKVIETNPLVKGYRFRAVLDARTSDICQEHDGEFIPKDDIQPGVNYPPLHPNCRSTVTTVLAGKNEKKDLTQRYTKNNKNQWIPVPPGMKYKEFEASMEQFRGTQVVARRGLTNSILRLDVVSQADPRITKVEGIKIVPNAVGSASAFDNRLTGNVSQLAQARYDKALREEKIISDSMIKLADKQGVSLSGIEFSAKTGSSTAEKIGRKLAKLDAGVPKPSDEQIIDEMNDLVRYTVVADHNDIAKVTEAYIRGLEDDGNEVIELDNKYLIGRTDYKGVHLNGVSKGGQKFEVQVHSVESLAAKAKNHVLYTEARKVSTSLERKAELDEQMKLVEDALPNPKGIENLKSFKKGVR